MRLDFLSPSLVGWKWQQQHSATGAPCLCFPPAHTGDTRPRHPMSPCLRPGVPAALARGNTAPWPFLCLPYPSCDCLQTLAFVRLFYL